MSQYVIVIAIGLVVCTGCGLTAWSTIRRLRTRLAAALWGLHHDRLTGLFNRDGLLATSTTIVASTTTRLVVVVLLDLDNFKLVNDSHGHAAGDDLLIQVAARVRETAELYGGIAARLSGDEYAAVLPVRAHGLARVADAFVTVIAQPVPITINGNHVTITPSVSVGIVVTETGDPFERVALHRADIAMYHAKLHGGNQFVFHEPGMAMPVSQSRRGPRLRDQRQWRQGTGGDND